MYQMNRKIVMLVVAFFCCFTMVGQQADMSQLHRNAVESAKGGDIAKTRYLFKRAYEDYVAKGQFGPAVECAVKTTSLYYKENYWKEAFDLLRVATQNVYASNQSEQQKASQYYVLVRERLRMYMKLRKLTSAKEQLTSMEQQVNVSGDEKLKDDLLYNKAIFHYTFGQNAEGNVVFKQMAAKLTASKDYDKVDEVYKKLISNATGSGSVNMVAQTYRNYIDWKDSVNALKAADEMEKLKSQISNLEDSIKDKDSSLAARRWAIVALGILAAILAGALVLGGVVLLRFIALTRKQKKTIKVANENIALKAKFISNISGQLDPTLKKLDSRLPEVKALLGFSEHIQMLSALESATDEPIEKEEVKVQKFCNQMADEIKGKVKSGVNVKVLAPDMTVSLNRDYTTHILRHLLSNAAEYAPEAGTITLEYKKRGAHKHQFLVTDTGQGIPEEKREDVFKPFVEPRDLTKGDGLGLPICKQMALRMDGDLEIDSEYVRGIRFVLSLQS